MLERLLGRRRLFLSSALLLSLAGLLSWQSMPRQEDPRYPNRDGLVSVRFPGAAPEAVERLVLDPIEDVLVELEELEKFDATARAGLVLLHLKLHDGIYATEQAWDEVERALDRARRDFPDGADDPVLDRDPYQPEAIVLALTGAADPMVLADATERLKDELRALPELARVELVGDPGEQILIELDEINVKRLGVTHRALALELAARNTTIPAGSLRMGDRQLLLRPNTEFASVDEIAATPVAIASGAKIPLAALARIRSGPLEPPRERMRLDGRRAVGLSLTPKDNVHMVAMGDSVRRLLTAAKPRYAPLEIHEVAFQPDHVARRMRDLGRALLWGMAIVASVLCASMGWRLGLVVASILPLVVLSSVALYAAGGGVLHQISIAGLVLSLGLLVDNAIIVAESAQRKIDAGSERGAAAAEAVRELVVPLGAATGTTLAAFLPLLLSRGMVADFIRTLPLVVMLTLSSSFVFALLITPSLAAAVLRPRSGPKAFSFRALAEHAASAAIGHPVRNLLAACAFVAASLIAAGSLERNFFPASDRSQILVDVELPEGGHLTGTDKAARRLEAALMARPEVRSVAAFVGRSTPLFYYNLPRRPSSPHLAQLVVVARERQSVAPLRRWIRDFARREIPEAMVVSRRLEQGRTILAPIEVRLSGGSAEELQRSAERVVVALREIEGCEDVRHDLGIGSPSLRLRIDDAAAQRYATSRDDVALALLARTRGLEVGHLRSGEDPVPILVRPSAGEELPLAQLASLGVVPRTGRAVPLGQLARSSLAWSPGAIRHRNGVRTVRVYAQLSEAVPYSRVLQQLSERATDLELPRSVRLEWGGEAEGSSQANLAILRTLPLGALLLILFVLAEFNSFRNLGIVLTTVPLAAAGIVPGLLLSGQPFGFMSLLGVVALLGIVVNNAIVLLDVIEGQRAMGASISSSVREAVLRRTRPILLTTITTVAGLLPLAFSSSPLWPPLAWAMISGLLASALLTLVVVPSFYLILFHESR
jgi:multidrug efflux pump subunit AcrB